jgi:hypothetical protein
MYSFILISQMSDATVNVAISFAVVHDSYICFMLGAGLYNLSLLCFYRTTRPFFVAITVFAGR